MSAVIGYSTATDMWVLQIDPATWRGTNRVLKAFNILSPGVGSNGGVAAEVPVESDGSGNIRYAGTSVWNAIPMPPSSDGVTPNIRVDMRLKNTGVNTLTIRSESQTVASGVAPDQSCTDPNWQGTQQDTCGKLIVTPYQTMQPGTESVHSHWWPMWNPAIHTGPMPNGIDQRFWVRNQAFGDTGAECSGPPPWTNCGRGQLYDFAGSSRHLVHLEVPTAMVGNDIQVIVHSAATQMPVQGATVTLMPSNAQLTTDVDGLVDFPVTPGTYSVLVHAVGFNDGFVANIIVPPNQQVVVELTGGTPIRYSCVGGQCVITTDGQYATLDECVSACGSTPTRYSCVDGICHPDANGQYASLEECQAACKGVPDHPDWKLTAAVAGIGAAAIGAAALAARGNGKKKRRRTPRKRSRA